MEFSLSSRRVGKKSHGSSELLGPPTQGKGEVGAEGRREEPRHTQTHTHRDRHRETHTHNRQTHQRRGREKWELKAGERKHDTHRHTDTHTQ